VSTSAQNAPRPVWFLRSMTDRDTHRGVYSPATRSVHATCGIEFIPYGSGWPLTESNYPGTRPTLTRSARTASAAESTRVRVVGDSR
jgi:hypothetical protein